MSGKVTIVSEGGFGGNGTYHYNSISVNGMTGHWIQAHGAEGWARGDEGGEEQQHLEELFFWGRRRRSGLAKRGRTGCVWISWPKP